MDVPLGFEAYSEGIRHAS